MNRMTENPMERHDQLYRIAYREYLANELEAARIHASLAAQIAQMSRNRTLKNMDNRTSTPRAAILLKEIEWCLLLAQDQ